MTAFGIAAVLQVRRGDGERGVVRAVRGRLQRGARRRLARRGRRVDEVAESERDRLRPGRRGPRSSADAPAFTTSPHTDDMNDVRVAHVTELHDVLRAAAEPGLERGQVRNAPVAGIEAELGQDGRPGARSVLEAGRRAAAGPPDREADERGRQRAPPRPGSAAVRANLIFMMLLARRVRRTRSAVSIVMTPSGVRSRRPWRRGPGVRVSGSLNSAMSSSWWSVI